MQNIRDIVQEFGLKTTEYPFGIPAKKNLDVEIAIQQQTLTGILRAGIRKSQLQKHEKTAIDGLIQKIEKSALMQLPRKFVREITRQTADKYNKSGKQAAIDFINELEIFAKNQQGLSVANKSEINIKEIALEIARQKQKTIDFLRESARAKVSKTVSALEELYRFLECVHEYGFKAKLKTEIVRCGDDKFKIINQKTVALAVNQLIDPKTWTRRIRRAAAQCREMLALKLKMVGGQSGQKYASSYNTKWVQQRKEETQKWAESQKIYEEDGSPVMIGEGENQRQMTLFDCMRTDEARFAELYTVFAGVEKRAQRQNMTWSFITATLPGEWHANPDYESKKTWNEQTVREGLTVLLEDWQRIRSQLAKYDIQLLGLRVAEPQKDGTAHLHLMVFHDAEQTEIIDAVLKNHWNRGQKSRKCSADQRWNSPALQIVGENKKRGSAASYIMKYIAKGVALETNDEGDITGSMVDVEAWRKIWGIRSFQFFGIKRALTLWKTLRKNRDNCPSGELRAAWIAAQGRWNSEQEKYVADFDAFLTAIDNIEIEKIFETDEFDRKKLIGYVDKITEEQILCKTHNFLITNVVIVNPNGPREALRASGGTDFDEKLGVKPDSGR
ncbi:MAG: replication endonuclease, partial [Gammaproteobacteria bacterium]|nr:replication endonuclease [Gammaproteobacteria bacterium]